MTALPSKPEAQKLLPRDNTTAYHLYDTVLLPAEKAASEATDDGATFRTMLARVVGYLLLYPPSTQARAVVQSEVERYGAERDPNKAIYDLGEMYVMDFILPFYSIPEETTPQVHGVEPRDFYESIEERARQGQLNPPRDTAEAKDFALEIVREDVDYRSINVVAAILERFGYGNVHDKLKGTKIHRLENIMTLATSLHALFRNFDIWFEKAHGDNQGNWYAVGSPSRSLYEMFEVPVPETIQFVAHANFPLPNPTYLHIHAACCRIARLSGAWRHLEGLFWEEVRKMEDRRLATRAGASADEQTNVRGWEQWERR